MNITTVKLIAFSPTGTTRKVLESIAEGIQAAAIESLDLTPPGAKTMRPVELLGELAIIGSPVYAGRVPLDIIDRMRKISGNGSPAVIVVVYGNRAYEDALLELRDVAANAGFRPVAAAAFIGEHSYSTGAAPIAAGRPDNNDLENARDFGSRVRRKLDSIRTPDELPVISPPGNHPYKERGGLSNIAPATDASLCNRCGECVSACPTAAIPAEDAVTTERSLCIRCCACVKICPVGARMMEDARIRQVADQLSVNCRARKEPEIFL